MSTVVISIELPDSALVSVASGAGSIAGTIARTSDGGWADDADDRRSAQSNTDDPWGGGSASTRAESDNGSAGRSGPSGNDSGRPVSGVATDDRGKRWTFGAPGAPQCQCGETSAMVEGKTNGKAWKQWRCAKSFDDWQNKCQFSQFIGGRK